MLSFNCIFVIYLVVEAITVRRYRVEINILNIKEITDYKSLMDLSRYLDAEKQERVSKFRREEDKIRGIIGGVLTNVIASKKTGINMMKIGYEYNQYRKPKFKNIEELEFNISHSGDYVISAFDKECLGVDVEELSAVKEHEDIAKSFFADSEYMWIKKQNAESKNRAFYKLWTLKESYVKFLGKGLNIPFDSFAFEYDKEKDEFYIKDLNERIRFFNRSLDNYELSACTTSKNIEIIKWNYSKLLEEIDNVIL